MAGRFIKLYDKILKWEWYSDINTFRLFVHLLLKANYKDLKFEGQKILRGQLVTSLPSLSSQTGLSVRQVRVSLDKLKLTGEVTSSSYARYRIITIVRYDEYQGNDRVDDRLMTGKTAAKRQADDRLMTGSRQADDRLVTASIEQIENIEQVEQIEPPTVVVSAKRFTPPTAEDVLDFCLENGLSIDVDRFMDYYTSNGWKVGRNPMKDWKATVRNWAKSDQEKQRAKAASNPATNYSQRDYSNEQDAAMERMMQWKPEDDDGSTI